jgi:hypothetical protein
MLRLAATLALTLSTPHVRAHAFDERYDIAVPLPYFIFGATAAVALSFVVAAVFARASDAAGESPRPLLNLGPVLPWLRAVGAVSSVMILAMVLAAALFGTRDPVMNLTPTFIWIVWWVGLSLVCACIANVWPALDPWRALCDGAARVVRRPKRIAPRCPYPRRLGAWPAVALLLFIGWFEVVYPEGAEPRRLGAAVVAWTVFTLSGYALFGREAWRRNGDVFAIYFETLGRFAPLARGPDTRSVELRAPGAALITLDLPSAAMVGFVIAMLAVVLFDGLLSGEAWWAAQAHVMRAVPVFADPRSARAGAAGLVVLWLLLLSGYALACWATALAAGRPPGRFVRAFAYTLVPIAIGYNIAHNFSNLLVQGQHAIALISDPLGRQWNLFGTAGHRPNMRIVDPRTTWHVAIAAIVGGHVISIWLAHRVALREVGTRAAATFACIPLTALMLIYTAISLAIIAEPMVRFGDPQPQTMWNGAP